MILRTMQVEGIHGLSKAVCKVYMLLQMVQALVLFHADHQWVQFGSRGTGAPARISMKIQKKNQAVILLFFFLISQVVILLNPERQYIGRGEVAVAN
ncbi:hypothetical protein GOBAR_AA23397 [Gossypium barbadense]|uniref:Uncharacterized protein n=1 Tax=Gossypium barbadense TaxID=3634 RepID=A0A2P5X1Q7_GOSBA|nr:hypothetical protein GOBAR_AA23397 [Gossypium barbadense]